MKFLKWLGSFIGGMFYYTTALILSFVVVAMILGGTTYYFYHNMYLSYINVQEKWTAYDETMVKEIRIYSDQIQKLKKEINSTTWNETATKQEFLNQIGLASNYLQKARYSMKYDEKVANYTNLRDVQGKIEIISTQMQIPYDQTKIANLESRNIRIKKEYNEMAKEWNDKTAKIPYRYINNVVKFHDWVLIP